MAMVFDFIRGGAVPPRDDRHRLYGVLPGGGVSIDDGSGAKPAARMIFVLDRLSFFLVTAAWSRPDGSFDLSGLPQYPLRRLAVVACDNENPAAPETVLNAVIQDFVSQVAPAPFVPPAPEAG